MYIYSFFCFQFSNRILNALAEFFAILNFIYFAHTAMLKAFNHSTWRIHFYFHINTGYLLIKEMKSMRPLSMCMPTQMHVSKS